MWGWREFRDELAGCNREGSEMHLETVIVRVWRYALEGRDGANMKAVIEQVWRYTCISKMYFGH